MNMRRTLKFFIFVFPVLMSYNCESPSTVEFSTFKLGITRLPAYELPPVEAPPIKRSKVAVLTHSRYLYYNLAKEIQAYYNGVLVHVDRLAEEALLYNPRFPSKMDSSAVDELIDTLKRIQPEHAIIVLSGPFSRDDELRAILFKAFCSIDEGMHLDLAYGYITATDDAEFGGRGAMRSDARDMFFRTKPSSNEIDKLLVASQLYLPRDLGELSNFFGETRYQYEWNAWARSVVRRYADTFTFRLWQADTVFRNDFSWEKNPDNEMRKFYVPNQLIFVIDGMSIFNRWGANYSKQVFDNLDLSGDILIIDKEANHSRDAAIKKGAYFYLYGSDWTNLRFLAKRISGRPLTIGQAIKDGINEAMDYFGVTRLDIDLNYLGFVSDKERHVVNALARTYPIGDPLYRPRLKSEVPLYLPPLF